MTHAAMNAAFDKGAARLLGEAINWVVRYRETWSVVYEHGWLRSTDAATAQDLDQAARRRAQAEAAAKRPGRGQPGSGHPPGVPSVCGPPARHSRAGGVLTDGMGRPAQKCTSDAPQCRRGGEWGRGIRRAERD
jgi:hypothetical protein